MAEQDNPEPRAPAGDAGMNLARRVADLEQSERRYRSLVELAPDVIYCLAEDGTILFISSSVRALGYEPADLVGKPFETLVLPEDVRKTRNRFVERRIGDRATRDMEVRLVTRGGAVRELDLRSVAVFARGLWDVPDDDIANPQKRFLGTQGIARDVTERKRAEEALAQKAGELERSNAELERFAYEVAHDLRSPLATVVSLIDLLADGTGAALDEDARQIIDQIATGASRMAQLVQDLLAYARVGSQGQEWTHVDCNSVLGQVRAGLASEIDQRSAEVTHDPLPIVTAHETQVIMLLQNLIQNGIKFNRDAKPHVHVTAEDGGDVWRFAVSDNGIGIPPEEVGRVFDMFQRVGNSGDFEGSGIGLATCRKIVDHHGGRIELESEPGIGSTFRFTLAKNLDR